MRLASRFNSSGLKTKGYDRALGFAAGAKSTTIVCGCSVPLDVFPIKAGWALHHALAPMDDEALQVRQVDLRAHL